MFFRCKTLFFLCKTLFSLANWFFHCRTLFCICKTLFFLCKTLFCRFVLRVTRLARSRPLPKPFNCKVLFAIHAVDDNKPGLCALIHPRGNLTGADVALEREAHGAKNSGVGQVSPEVVHHKKQAKIEALGVKAEGVYSLARQITVSDVPSWHFNPSLKWQAIRRGRWLLCRCWRCAVLRLGCIGLLVLLALRSGLLLLVLSLRLGCLLLAVAVKGKPHCAGANHDLLALLAGLSLKSVDFQFAINKDLVTLACLFVDDLCRLSERDNIKKTSRFLSARKRVDGNGNPQWPFGLVINDGFECLPMIVALL